MTAHAEDELKPVDFCTDLSLVANQVMKARQKDRPMSETLPMAKNRIKSWGDKYGREMDIDEAEAIAAEMVMAAYEEMISTDPFKKQTTTEFENAFFKQCYEEATSDSN